MGRNTMQCVIIVSVHNGTKTVFPVGSPAVYNVEAIQNHHEEEGFLQPLENKEEEEDSPLPFNVRGGSHEELAKSLKKALTDRLKLGEDVITGLTGEFFLENHFLFNYDNAACIWVTFHLLFLVPFNCLNS